MRIPVEHIFKKEYSWPGDFEGRTILALVMLEQSTHMVEYYLMNTRTPDKIFTKVLRLRGSKNFH